MRRRFKKINYRRRHRSLNSSNLGPILKLSAVVLLVLIALFAIIFVALPKLLPLVGIEYNSPLFPTPTPEPTPEPTPTPHPIEAYVPEDNEHEIIVSSNDYRWYADPFHYNGEIMFSGGKLVDGNVHLSTLLNYNVEANQTKEVGIELNNAHFLFPRFNDKWLVYIDGNLNGGGDLMVVDRTQSPLVPRLIKHIYVGQCRVKLDGDYIAWIEHTGTNMDKLFVCDLNTLETTTLATFNSSSYGQSTPDIHDGIVVWAEQSESDGNGIIKSANINTGEISIFAPLTYVHDVEYNGTYFAWLDSLHSEDTKLYISKGNSGENILVCDDVVEYGLSDDFIAYSTDETVYIYIFSQEKSYRVTPDRERVQFMGVSDNMIIWMDVTTRERDVLRYAFVPVD